jgi:hypothetical protein
MNLARVTSRTAAATPVPYEAFRTGLTFREVRAMLWSPSDDPRQWRQKRRSSVLGKWREIKLELYDQYVGRLDLVADVQKSDFLYIRTVDPRRFRPPASREMRRWSRPRR